MDIERERGITIKSQAVRMKYKAKDGSLKVEDEILLMAAQKKFTKGDVDV